MSLEQAATAVEVTGKYMMDKARDRSASHLLRYAKAEPLRVYAIACRCKLFDVARVAARYTLEEPLLPLPHPMPSELDQLSTSLFFYELLQYRHRCTVAVLNVFGSQSWEDRSSCTVFFGSGHSAPCTSGVGRRVGFRSGSGRRRMMLAIMKTPR